MAVDPNVLSALAAAAAGAGTSSSGASNPTTREATSRDTKYQVYLGTHNAKGVYSGSANAEEHDVQTGVKTHKVDKVTTIDEAVASWYDMSDAERSAWAKNAFALGYTTDPNDLTNAEQTWQWAVQKSSNFYMSKSRKKITPQQVMDMYAGGNATGKGKAGQTITQKNRVVDVSNPTEARAIVEKAFQTSVGRDPTDSEVRTMVNALQAKQRANPEVQSQTVTYDANGNPSNTTQTSTGGIDPEQYVNSNVQNDPEAAAYQGATQYFPALLPALGSAV